MRNCQPLPQKTLKPQEKQAIQDRLRLNAMQVKEQEQINRERKAQDEAEAARAASRVAKSKAQFSHVSSKVVIPGVNVANMNGELPSSSHTYQAPEDDVEITVFVRETERDGGVQKMMESDLLRLNERDYNSGFSSNGSGAAAVKKNTFGLPQQQQQQTREPLRLNNANNSQPRSLQQQQQQQPRSSSSTHHKPSAPDGNKLGSVPDYLRQRKAELQAEKDAAARAIIEEQERNKHPVGHRPVSEDERQAVLAKLDARKLELERDLARLPMRFDTLAVKNRRTEIEKEMSEVEEAHRRFSVKKQLYVPA